MTQGSSSSSRRFDARFLSAQNEDAYYKYKEAKITPSRMLNQSALHFEGQEQAEPDFDEEGEAAPTGTPPPPVPPPAPAYPYDDVTQRL
ncbi:hypothetical protein M5K25_017971 [Dendrobium thyrsiflorum]|uniref:Uncharacterized protein n=1 Tax=Dendrobium thyrsiflorum TaxID=117978 RepID=A0ABD0UGP0_DENTH